MRQQATLTTVEMDKSRAGVAERLFKPNADISSSATRFLRVTPWICTYDLVFVNGFGPTRDLLGETGKLLTSMLKIGGIVLFDDERPSRWPQEDVSGNIKRAYLHSANELTCMEIPLTTNGRPW